MEHRGVTVWFTGLSGAGKTTISHALAERLKAAGCKLEILDGDIVRTNLTKGLGFSKEDRDENIRRIGFVSHLLTRNGVIVFVSAISPYREIREEVRQRIGDFVEIFVNAPSKNVNGGTLKVFINGQEQVKLKVLPGLMIPMKLPRILKWSAALTSKNSKKASKK